MFILAGGALGLAAIAVALIIVLGGGSSTSTSSNGATSAYKAKLTSAMAPVMAANTALSASLNALTGSNTTAAKNAVGEAQSAVSAGRGAVAVLTVPAATTQLSQQAQQALAQEDGYLQGVNAVLTGPTPSNSAQLQALGAGAQSALIALGSVAPSGDRPSAERAHSARGPPRRSRPPLTTRSQRRRYQPRRR